MRVEHLIAALIPLTYFLMVLVERFSSNRVWPSIKYWQLTGIGFFIMLGIVNNVVAILARKIFPDIYLFDASQLGILKAGLIAYVLVSLGNALMHRAYHHYDWLWRHVHQLHHTPRRLDVAGVMYQTPWEAFGSALLFVFVTVFLLRLDPPASALVAYVAAFYGMFQHFNIRTPVWLGYLIQRPEAHCLHHQRGVHANNYSDLPIWDMVWGTFRNPVSFRGELGFEHASGKTFWPMLSGRDVPVNRQQDESEPETRH